jgi:hypothetical protein
MTEGVAVFSARWLYLGALLVGALLTASCGGSGGSSPHVVTASPPPPGIVLVPASLAFSGVGAVNASTVKVSETDYSGDFTIKTSSSSCLNGSSTIAGQPAAKVTIAPPDHGTLFTVTPTQAGACDIVLSDDSGHSASLQVEIAVTTVGGS